MNGCLVVVVSMIGLFVFFVGLLVNPFLTILAGLAVAGIVGVAVFGATLLHVAFALVRLLSAGIVALVARIKAARQ